MLLHANEVYKKALTLSPIERIELIEHLYYSLDSPALRKHIDALWAEEAEDRISAFESGEVEAIPAKQVFAKLESQKAK